MMDKVSEDEGYMLCELLNIGDLYLVRDAAYPNIDGAFTGSAEIKLEEDIRRGKVLCDLHERVGKCEMVGHEFADGNRQIQKRLLQMEPLY